MAEVYKAKTIGIAGFEKILALKRIRPNRAREARFIRNFIDEARIAMTLNHRNIVQVFDFGKADGELFLAMELLEGVDLRMALQAIGPGQRMPAALSAYLLSEVAAGLDYAHRKTDREGTSLGIVHCDVSPHNVLLSREGFVKILDFGVARARFVATPSSRRLRGKPRYMSPEQTRGDTATAASDVFVVGILAWELLSGRKLFTGENLEAILKSVRESEITPICSIRPDLPEFLCDGVMRALDRVPERRGTARQIASELAHASRELSEESNAQALSSWLGKHCPLAAMETITDVAPVPDTETASPPRLALAADASALSDEPTALSDAPLLTDLIDKRRVVIAVLRLDGGKRARRLELSRALCDLAYKHGAVIHRSRNLVLNKFNTQIPKRSASQTPDTTPPSEAIRCFSDEEHQLPSSEEVVAIFGLEFVGEDNIASSMYFAIDAAELVREAVASQPVSLRFAARSGVVANRREDGGYQLRGDALSEAQELVRNAEPFRPLLSGGAGRVASARFQFRELAARRHRSRRLRVLELTGPSGHDDRRRALRERRGLFVGRASELQHLRSHFDQVIRNRRPSAIIVQGATGIGKSRLISEFVASLGEDRDAPLLIAVTATNQATAPPLALAVEYMRATLNLPPGRGKDARTRLAQGLASSLRDRANEEQILDACQSFELAMELGDGTLGIDDDAAAALRARCAHALALVQQHVASHGPSLVVLEDFDRADPASVDVLRHLLTRDEQDLPCLFLLSARNELADEHKLDLATGIELEELSEEERDRLIQDRLAEPNDQGSADLVAHRAGGNPLYIEELCRTIREVGQDATPITLRDSVQARVDRLSARSRAVLQRAAVIGETFRFNILEELLGVAASPTLQDLVEEGLLAQTSRADVKSEGGEFSFRHGLIREVVYSSLSTQARKATHASVGRLLALRAESGLDEPPAIVAWHLGIGGDAQASARQWVRAGQVALAAFEITTAQDAFERAIALIETLVPEQRQTVDALYREALAGKARAG